MMHRQLAASTLHFPLYSRKPLRQRRSPLRCSGTQSSAGERMQAKENWRLFWEKYKTSKPSHMSGWEGEFVSYAPTGAGEEDVRFQDIWYRGFQEKGEDGRFHMKMIRKADQEAKSWPRAGRERHDGLDETTLSGTEEDSSFPSGFWHPYGRGNDKLPPSRVVCLSADVIAQVTLQFPSVDAVKSAQEWDFMGSSEITFISGGNRLAHEGKRVILTVTYKGGGDGSILFHQASWDPVFVEDVDPEWSINLPARRHLHEDQRPPLPEDVQEWPIEEGVPGKAVIMRYKKEEQCWERLPEVDVTYSHPDSSGQVLYRYADGMYGLYPKTIGDGAPLVFEAGVITGGVDVWKYIARYHDDRSINTIEWHRYDDETHIAAHS